jgi:hypothetical protein
MTETDEKFHPQMFADLQHLQLLLSTSSLAAKKHIEPNSNKTATKEQDVAAQDPKYPNDILAYVLSCTNDEDDNIICTFVKPGDEIDMSSED